MEFQFSLALPMRAPIDLNNDGVLTKSSKQLQVTKYDHKRTFADAFCSGDAAGFRNKTTNLSLLLWNGQPNDEDDDGGGYRDKIRQNSDTCTRDVPLVVGWPPVKSWRRKQLHEQQQQQVRGHEDVVGVVTEERSAVLMNGRRNSMYVKVKMEGIPIGRKIDLRLYHSYQTLTTSLINMFSKGGNRTAEGNNSSNDDNSGCYTLLYQDNEGDWLLAGDVSWQTFIKSVQRLEILRTAG